IVRAEARPRGERDPPRDPSGLGRALPGRASRGRGLAHEGPDCPSPLPVARLRGRGLRPRRGERPTPSALHPPESLTPVRLRQLRLARAAGLALLAAAASGQETLSTLEAHVRNGPAIAADRRVRLEGPGLLRETTTDARGIAVFFHLRPGDYRLVVAPSEGAAGALCEHGVSISAAQDARVAVDCAVPAERLVAGTETEREGTTTWESSDLASLPRPTDPWSVVRDVPGVVTD